MHAYILKPIFLSPIRFCALFADSSPPGSLEEKCKWFLPLLSQPPERPQSHSSGSKSRALSNSCRETRSFTTALSSILSGFEWIKGKVEKWKAIKGLLQVTRATSVFRLTLHHVTRIWWDLITERTVCTCECSSRCSRGEIRGIWTVIFSKEGEIEHSPPTVRLKQVWVCVEISRGVSCPHTEGHCVNGWKGRVVLSRSTKDNSEGQFRQLSGQVLFHSFTFSQVTV